MCVEVVVDEGLNNRLLDSRERRVNSEEGIDGDAKMEVTVASTGKKSGSSGSGKRVHSQMIDEDLVCLDWKKKNWGTVNYAVDDETRSVVGESVGEWEVGDEDGDVMNVEVGSSRFSGMLGWLTEVAKYPCDERLGPLPEWSKWKCYGSQEMWKQVLLAREVLFVKRSDAVDSRWQKNQRMHPFMYGNQSGYSYHLRDRLNCKKKSARRASSNGKACSESNTSGAQRNGDRSPSASTILIDDNSDGNMTSDSSTVDSLFCNQPRQRIRLGSRFQVDVPKWNGLTSEIDSKWLGTQVWPLLRPERRNLIERDPIGKGSQNACGCASRGSVDCVRFHIAEKRFKLKMELGSAFFFWRFDKMGEEAILPWTKREEDKFSEIVKRNPLSELKSFWDELLEAFPGKRREELVGYYYNAFLLKRREHQNRRSPLVINSDDDESESCVPVKSTNSIFYSPAKQKSKS